MPFVHNVVATMSLSIIAETDSGSIRARHYKYVKARTEVKPGWP